MKRILTLILTAVFALALPAALTACSGNEPSPADTSAPETDAPATDAPETEPPAPTLVPSGHEISVSEIESILAANGMRTNINRASPYPAYHGGQQMRVVHTERGTYATFVTYFGRENWAAKFVVTKTDNDGNNTLVYAGDYLLEHNETLPNIGQDTNGDVIVALGCAATLDVYVIDHETDAVTRYSAPAEFHIVDGLYGKVTVDKKGEVEGYELPGYTNIMFDFENRKIYAFYGGGAYTGNWMLEWFTFDMETKEWEYDSQYVVIEGIRRFEYLFPFPDGNGGAYIVGERDDAAELEEELWETGGASYLWDELRLFHIPDLTSSENVTHTVIHGPYEYSELGHKGIWSSVSNGHQGGAFMDADGYLHVTYLWSLGDLTGSNTDFVPVSEYRHAIYKGMECIYNEKLEFAEPSYSGYQGYKPLLMQRTDGTLFMLAFKQSASRDNVEIYRAEDPLGKTWKLEKILTVDLDGTTSFSMSAKRDGSAQDDVVSCFLHSYSPLRTVYTFEISLKDYGMTKVTDVLAGYDLIVDDKIDRRAYSSSHTTKIVHTSGAAYAAFTYNFVFGGLDLIEREDGKKEQFHIVKIGADGQATVLFSGEYKSLMQDRYLNMREMPDGKIWVILPEGYTAYAIDPATDEVKEYQIEKQKFSGRQQTDIVTVPETGKSYALFGMRTAPFTLTGYGFEANGRFLDKNSQKVYTFDRELNAGYTGLYTLSDGKRGAYIVGTRTVGQTGVATFYLTPDGELKRDGTDQGHMVLVGQTYRAPLPENLQFGGHTFAINDSLMLFCIPDLESDTEVKCVEIEPPYDAEGSDGIWSVVDAANCGDAYLDADGKLHVFYTVYRFDFDDTDRPGNAALIADTLKHMHAVYDGTALVSCEELGIEGLTKDSSVRMAQTADGTVYLLVCNIGEAGAKIDVYFETENGWAHTAAYDLGEITAESFSISGPRGGSVQDGTVDCLVYATDNDVYHVQITFAKGE